MPWTSQNLVLIVGALLLHASVFGQEKGRVTITEKEGQFATADDAKTVRIRVGDTLIVKIPATPANGSVWHVAIPEGLKETEATKYDTKEARPGAKGKQVFQIVVEKPGQYILVFRLERGDALRGICVFKIDARE